MWQSCMLSKHSPVWCNIYGLALYILPVCDGVATNRPSTAWQPPPPAHSHSNASQCSPYPPPPAFPLAPLINVVLPFSPSPSSHAALCTKDILHSAGVRDTRSWIILHAYLHFAVKMYRVTSAVGKHQTPSPLRKYFIVIPAVVPFTNGI